MSNRRKIQEIRAAGRRVAANWDRRREFIAEVRRAFREGPTRFRETDRTNKIVIVCVLAMVAAIIAMLVV